MVKFTFEEGPVRLKNAALANPQVIGEALMKISQEHGGHLKPEDIVETAKDPDHPLHRHFEWDDQKAAYAHRLSQARGIVRIVRIVEDNRVERAFVSIGAVEGRSYRTLKDVKMSLPMQLVLLKQLKREIDAATNRYEDLLGFCDDIREAGRKLDERIAMEEAIYAGV